MTVLIFFVVLFLLILVHEFGHFIVAKISGIRVDEFGIGFPPKLFGKKFGETEYTFNALPIGGFVRIWGENPTEEHYGDGPEAKRSFVKQSRFIQALVLVAGVSMNVFFAFTLYVGAYMIGIPTSVSTIEEAQELGIDDVRLFVSSVVPDAPAFDILKPSDVIVGVHTDDNSLTSPTTLPSEDVSNFIANSSGLPVTLDIMRRNESMSVTVQPQKNIISDEPDRYAAGFTLTLAGTERISFFPALLAGAERTVYSLIDVVLGLYILFTGGADLAQVSGPVGIVNLVGDAAALGFTWLLVFSAFISLNLAVINLLPIPALDGGRLLFVGIESITRKPIKPSLARTLNMIGFITILSLIFMVTISDIAKLF